MPLPQNILQFLTGGYQDPQVMPQPDMAQSILSGRFNQEPTANDIGNAALAGISSDKYVNPQDYTDNRLSNAMKQMAAVAELQQLPIKQLTAQAALAKALRPELPTGYQWNAATGQAEGIPGVDPTYLKKADPYAMPMPVILPNGQPGFAPKADVTKPGYQPYVGNPAVKANAAAPQIVEQGKQTVDLIDSLIGNPEKGIAPHPGLETSVGAKGPTGGLMMGWVPPGTDAADFNARLAQLQGQNFLQAYQTLKGGGQITEVEGKKAEAAIARLSTSQSEAAFKKSLMDLREVVHNGVIRASGGEPVQPAVNPTQITPEQAMQELQRRQKIQSSGGGM